MSVYKASIQKDQSIAKEYYQKSVVKTQQQVFLETLLSAGDTNNPLKIGDIACGGGTLTYHLKKLYPGSAFTLVDFNEDALKLAEELNGTENCSYLNDTVYSLDKIGDAAFDHVFCWQTLSWLDQPEKALDALLRVTRKGGTLFLSSLFNLKFDVDLYTNVFDHTRESTKDGLYVHYNTYSAHTVGQWLKDKVSGFRFYEFMPTDDIPQNMDNKGLGTFTTLTSEGQRLQVSGGLLMNWAILVIEK